jgi:membrane protease YdiL (CAAX protease family)
MTPLPSAARRAWPEAASDRRRPWVTSAAVLIGLWGIVGARWLATTRGLDALMIGASFGLGLALLWLVAAERGRRAPGPRGWRPAPLVGPITGRLAVAAGIGFAFGLLLVVLAIAGASIGSSPIVPGLSRPAAPFLTWAGITILVATAEEGILRGVLFDRLRTAGGLAPTLIVTSIAFALLHVPLYGWHVVPLDLAVGLAFGGLRLSTRTVVAPAVAHAVADIATWWL